MDEYIFENFFIEAPTDMLKIPLSLTAFRKLDENGVWDGQSQHTLPGYLATFGHTVERFNKDKTMFIKGLGFNIVVLDEMRTKLTNYGLEENVNFFIHSPGEIKDVLKRPEWNTEKETI